MLSTDTSWLHIFKELVRSGKWASLSPSAAKLYVVVKAYSNWDSGVAFPTIDAMCKFSGLSRATLIKALNELVEAKLVRKDNAPGHAGRYCIQEHFDIADPSGNPHSHVSFDYIPGGITEAIAQLKNFVATGAAPDGGIQIIQIETLNIQINKDAAQGVQNNLPTRRGKKQQDL
jgi:hypothetical protein